MPGSIPRPPVSDQGRCADSSRRRLVRVGFPRLLLAASAADSHGWRRHFLSTFLERDLGVLGLGMATRIRAPIFNSRDQIVQHNA
ncbi:MAG: hypothetical protein JNK49_16235 [Planctomycetes bacterium]|nr:hypothetical protein [Planctomycetota bacterium]